MDCGFTILKDTSRQPGALVERDGVHFGCYASGNQRPVLLLYEKGSKEVAAALPFPDQEGDDGFYRMKVKLQPSRYEYNFQEGDSVYTDPYAQIVAGRESYGARPDASPHGLRGGFGAGHYKWEGDQLPRIPYEDVVMYHLHVRGFTMHSNSGVRKKGTFAGIKEKIPYLKKLGVNQLRFMPVYEFAELLPQESHGWKPAGIELKSGTMDPGQTDSFRMNYWGYGDGFYFAPKAGYTAGKSPDTEFKDLVKACHREGIEIVLEFSFGETADMFMITRCLGFWASEYHIDGFGVMARDSVVAELARLPLFRSRKLICTWYPEQVKSHNKKNHGLLAEANDGFMNDCRRILKGDEGCMQNFSFRVRGGAVCPQINYITNHDGFTLLDLVSYNQKHNEENGEQGRDGSDYNLSWNCGVEGPSKKRDIAALRMRQRKNAYAMLLFSQGTPMLLAGDEFGNTQNGNNNPYCHDSELTWLDWKKTKANKELTEFVTRAVAYRKAHPMLHQSRQLTCTDQLSSGYPDLSFHSDKAWFGGMDPSCLHIGCMYAGSYAGEDGFLYIAYNFSWEEKEFALPLLPKGMGWYKVMDTSLAESFFSDACQKPVGNVKTFTVPERTVVLLEGRSEDLSQISEAEK